MIVSIAGIVLIVLGLAVLTLQRFYSSVPARELKRLASHGDPLAMQLYRPVAYGASMRLLLWLAFCTTLSAGFYLVAYSLIPIAALVVMLFGVAAAVLLQSIRLTVRSAHIVVRTAPALAWVLNYVHRPFDMVVWCINRFRNHEGHSGMYEKEDLVDLFNQQKHQPDNRIASHDLELVIQALVFDDRQAADVTLAMSRTRPVSKDDHLGPVLLGELHDSGQDSFLVYDGSPDKVVGTLFLRDAVESKAGGRVSSIMHPKVCYVHEDFNLRQVLQAFAKTGQFMAVVINSFAEPVGVITLKHLLSQLLGERSADDFDAFEDKTAVATWRPAPVPVTVDDGQEMQPEEPISEGID